MYNEGLFLYKNCVNIPPLRMCNDIASISLCGVDSIKTNAILDLKIESMKLRFGTNKCFNIHIVKSQEKCCDLKVHGTLMKRRSLIFPLLMWNAAVGRMIEILHTE